MFSLDQPVVKWRLVSRITQKLQYLLEIQYYKEPVNKVQIITQFNPKNDEDIVFLSEIQQKMVKSLRKTSLEIICCTEMII